MKRGLKFVVIQIKCLASYVKEDSPMKRGLKFCLFPAVSHYLGKLKRTPR